MRLILIDEWRIVFARAWSVRWMLIAGLFAAIEVAVATIGPSLPIPLWLFAALSALSTAAALVSRLLVQRSLPDGQ